jgi:alpha-tubulin suppressor-like RCC1 family protein
MHAIFVPQRIAGALDGLFVVDAAAGEEMSIIVAQGKKAGIIYEQVFACGNNLKGSLGINRTSHLQDLTLVPDLSDLFDETEQALMINHISCGRRHCVANYDYGAFMYWGDN